VLVDKLKNTVFFTGLTYHVSSVFFDPPPISLQIAFISFEILKLIIALNLGFPQRYFNLFKETKLLFCRSAAINFLLRTSIFFSAVFISWNSSHVLSQNLVGRPKMAMTLFDFLPNLMLSYGAFRLIEIYFHYHRELTVSQRFRKKRHGFKVSYQMVIAFLMVAVVYRYRHEPWLNVIATGLRSMFEVLLPVTIELARIEDSYFSRFWKYHYPTKLIDSHFNTDMGFVSNMS